MYDKNNVFAKIIRGEIPSKKIVENEFAMSFYDVKPITDVHVLVIPKGEYENVLDFTKNAPEIEQTAFWKCFVETVDKLGVMCDFNVLANAGKNAPLAEQSVFHFHLHITAGKRICK